MTTAYVAWRSPTLRRWYPIGRLRSLTSQYEFVYTVGAGTAARDAGFEPLASFPELETRYVSTELFPLFANRLLSKSRREYPAFVEWVSFAEHETDPVALLARSGGRRATDALEIFQAPQRDVSGLVRMHFFVHGMQHFSEMAVVRAAHLKAGEPLMLMHDFQNPHDSRALVIRTAETVPGDIHALGYCPGYLLDDVFELLIKTPQSVRVTVLRVNSPPAPIWFRLLCTLVAEWPANYAPLSGPAYRPLSENARTVVVHALASRSHDVDRLPRSAV